MVSEDVRLAFAFIVLLRLAGVSQCFSTHSALGPFFTVWLPHLDSLLDVACQPADPISCFVSAVTVCPQRFPLDFSALGAYVPFLLWSTWCASWRRHLLRPCSASIGVASACWVLSRRLSGLRLVASGEEQTKDPFPPSVFEKRVEHASVLPATEKPTKMFWGNNLWVKNRLRTPRPRRFLKESLSCGSQATCGLEHAKILDKR